MAVQPFFTERFGAGAIGDIPDPDSGNVFPEQQLRLPWCFSPEVTWWDYLCWVEIDLDAGMALHKALPQSDPDPDTLATVGINAGNLDTITPASGVNLNSTSTAQDVIQRMASSTYRFTVKGYGRRIGYQVPVPGLLQVGRQTPVPADGQWTSGNMLIGNMAGIPLFLCAWRLPYWVSGPLASSGTGGQVEAPVPFNPGLHIRGDAKLPDSIVLPLSQTDDRAVETRVLRAFGLNVRGR